MKVNIYKIKVLMAEKEIGVKQLSELAGISTPGLGGIFRKGKAATVTVGKLAKALGVPVEEITIEEVQPCQA